MATAHLGTKGREESSGLVSSFLFALVWPLLLAREACISQKREQCFSPVVGNESSVPPEGIQKA